MGEKWSIQFCLQHATSTVSVGNFYMPQIYDMGQTALLSLRRKACREFFRPKNPTASAGFVPANLGTRGQHANFISLLKVFIAQNFSVQTYTWIQ
jgi:hypothetical protein